MRPFFLLPLLLLPLITAAVEPQLPPQDRLITADVLAKHGFFKQSVARFDGWDYAFDGGSTGFFFVTASGLKFTILVANRRYWTEAEKMAGTQVYFLVISQEGVPRKAAFFRIVPKSEEEEQIIRMISDGLPNYTGSGRSSREVAEGLLQAVRSRKQLK